MLQNLRTKPVESTTLALERIDYVHRGHSLATGMLSVGNGILDDGFEEDLENIAGFFVDETRDALHTATTGQTANGWLGDTLDVIPQDLAMALGTALSKTLTAFAASRHSV